MNDNRDRTGSESRKQAVSIRMNRSDVRNIKRLADRLGARDSDVIRFAIKLTLGRLSLLQDPAVRGRSLVPLFLELGPELMRHFELDYARLSSIINDGVEQERCVDPDDIQLLAMHGLQRSYLKLRVATIRRAQGAIGTGSSRALDALGAGGVSASRPDGHGASDADAVEESLRQYMYEKYLYGDDTQILATGSGGG
jgi:hypothetical protein